MSSDSRKCSQRTIDPRSSLHDRLVAAFANEQVLSPHVPRLILIIRLMRNIRAQDQLHKAPRICRNNNFETYKIETHMYGYVSDGWRHYATVSV